MIDDHGVDLGLPSRAWVGTISFEQLEEDFVVGNTSAIAVRKNALDRVGAFSQPNLMWSRAIGFKSDTAAIGGKLGGRVQHFFQRPLDHIGDFRQRFERHGSPKSNDNVI
jgi:hypothetical protein